MLMRTWQGICLSAVMLASLAGACRAQNLPEQEYKKLIRVSEDIQPLGENPFGEQVSLYDGSLSFSQTDINLTGTGPVLQLTRSLHSITDESPPSESNDGSFADWNIEIPRITTTAAVLNQGWTIGIAHSTARCTQFGIPWTVPARNGGADWEPHSWWSGYQMIVPGFGSQDLLKRDATNNTLTPQMGGATFNIVTTHNWMLTCGVATDDGTGGEGFLAVAPDGTKYTFNHLIYRWAPNITRALGSSPAQIVGVHPMLLPSDFLQREQGVMLVTRVEDRFGNYLTYNYDAANPKRLNSIVASDGRQISLTYDPVDGTNVRIKTASVTSGSTSRTWTYGYGSHLGFYWLTSVTLPDSSSWSFDGGLSYTDMSTEIPGTCDQPTTYDDRSWTTTMVHPSGLTGSFTAKPAIRGRSYVYRDCVTTSPTSSYSTYPRFYYVPSIVSKTFTGAGLPARTWAYTFSPANPSWTTDACATSQTCADTVWADVLDPDGHDVRYTFSNRYDASESHLVRTDFYSGAFGTTLKRSETNGYAAPTSGPFPSVYGDNFQNRINQAQVVTVSPQNLRTITQDGDTYTWQAIAFDSYAQPTDVKRYNDIVGQSAIEEQTTYLNAPALWVLGLPLQVTNVATGEVESANTYDPSNDTLLTRSRFGQPLMSYTFNGAGQLASFTDGNSHTTSLSNYKRGIPQTINYPDSTSETLAVDDFGQISSLTDQAGHTTSYSYDPIGRISGITYPAGDEVAWTPEAFAYSYVASAERGLPANHWKRTTTTGGATTVTYFDAMLRPVLSDSDLGSTVQASTLTTYDSKGQKLFSAYPSTTALTFSQAPTVAGSTTTYDALGRATQVQQDSELGTLTSSTAYLSGARQQITDPKGNVTTTSYQVFDEPSYNAVIQVQAPTGITQTITRDVYGNPLSIIQSGLYGTESDSVTKTLTYDSYHRLCRTTEPESNSEVMNYDGANNLQWSAAGLTITGTGCGQEQVAAAAQTTRTYDAMNRLKTILPPAGTQSTSYGYDAVGRLTLAVSGISTWSSTYNFRGMLTSEALQLVGQNAWGIGYAHDANGSLSLIHYPDGENVSYAPDALGRPTQAGSYASGVNYFANGQVKDFVLGNGVAYAADQCRSDPKNCRQLLRNFSYGPGTPQLSEDLDYDANGNITAVTDEAGGPRNKSFGYDALNRLTSANAAGLWGTQAYTYDALNNLRTLQTGAQISTYAYDTTNKLTSISSGGSTLASYLYDTRGNVTGKNAVTLVFDQKNQLTQIAGSDTYAYDASGRRVSKTVGGTTTYYFYNQAGQLMYQWAPSLSQSTDFIYLGSKMVGDNESVTLGAPATIGFDANPNNGSYTVSWGAVAAATSYVLQESANGGAWTTVYSGSATSAALSGRAGGGYVYQVEGCIGTTCGAFTSSATLGVRPALPTVTVPSGTINGTYTVSWTAPASTTGYDVQERLGSGSWTTIASNTAATSISRPGTTSGSYTYQVSAKNAYGTRGWTASSAVTVDTTYGVLPSVPANLSVPAASNNGAANLSWGAATLATSYVVQQSGNGGTNWSTVYNSTGTSTSLSGLADGNYVFHVQACNTYGCSAWVAGSATLVVTHPPTTAPTISVPANNTNGSYTVSWSGVAGPVSYTLQEQINGGSWTTVQTNGLTSWSTTGRSNGAYGYHVQVCNVGGCGPWSSVGTTTVLLLPAVPATITIPATSSGAVPVSWAASSTATSYTLQHANYGITGWSTAYTGNATTYTSQETTAGAWIYQVQACNASGCSAFLVSSGGTLVTIPPATAPSLSVPTSSTTGNYTVSWGAVTAATSYTLQEQVNGGGWSTIQSNGSTSDALSGKGNGTYGYRVQACNAGGCGPWSGVGTITVTLIPASPGTPSVSSSGPSYKPVVLVSWGVVTNATSYQLEETNPDDGVNIVYTGSSTSWSQLILVTGTVQFRVKACSSAGCSAFSGYRSITLNSGL